MSLSRCLKKLGVSQHEAAIFKAVFDDYRADGIEPLEAARKAVQERLTDLLAERESVSKQVQEAGGVVPAPAATLELTPQTNAEALAAEKAKAKAEADAAKPAPSTGPSVKADQVDMFNTQEGLFGERTPQPGELGAEPATTPAAESERVKSSQISPKSPEELRALDDLKAGLADLGDILGKGTKLNITPEQEQKLLPVLTKIFDAAFRLGHIKFKQAARYVLEQIRAALGEAVAELITLEHLQGAYIAMSARYRDKGAESAVAVAAVVELEALIGTPQDPVEAERQPAPAPGEAPAAEPIVEHVTGKGKTLRGVVRKIPADEAKAIDPFTFRKDGGYFIREKYLSAATAPVPAPVSTPEPAPAPTQSPAMTIATWVKGQLNRPSAIASMSWRDLFAKADEAYGGTQAEGKYTPKDAYDAMEAGMNLYIIDNANAYAPAVDRAKALLVIKALEDRTSRLPTQTKRTQEQDDFQQFSTIPPFAYAAAWVAHIKPTDIFLEPSAGIGGLAAFAENAGAKLYLNELSERRAALLAEVFPAATVFHENAEQLDNILAPDIRPTVVVMNPPFSSTAGRLRTNSSMVGARHIEQALQRLAPGGRLVAISGQGMAHNAPAFKAWWEKIGSSYDVRAVIPVDGAGYAKYGTTFDNVLIVIDKVAPTGRPIVTTPAGAYSELVGLLASVQEDRPATKIEGDANGWVDRAHVGPTPDAVIPQREGADGTAASDGARPVGSGEPRGRPAVDSGRVERDPASRGPGRDDGKPVDARPAASNDAAGRRQADPADSSGPDTPGNVDVSVGTNAAAELTDSVFEPYQPQRLKIDGARGHPGPLEESAAMASVLPPAPTYRPNLPKETITEGKLSLAQLESVVYAGQAHEQLLPEVEEESKTPYRRGYFIGDGTGVGKGREIAGIILDNIRRGRKKAVWISEKQGLMNDAKRDFKGAGGDDSLIFNQNKTKAEAGIDVKNGVLFTTYSTLRSGAAVKDKAPDATPAQSRLDQLVAWLGKDFDGALVFDESHNAGNAIAMKGERGMSAPAAQALAVVDLQKRLPNARVVYVSATGATSVSNLAYATRLGLWGEGTAFDGVRGFISEMTAGGLATMELVARDLKQLGAYISRSLSFRGVTYGRVEHELTDLQQDIYNRLADAWQVTLRNMNEALEMTGVTQNGVTRNGRQLGAMRSAYWGAQQRFFNQIITSMQMPSAIEQIERDLANGDAVVLQLVNTNEAQQTRALEKRVDEEQTDLEELDLTPRDQLINMVRKAFPVQQFEDYIDEEGNRRSRGVVDSTGKPVENKQAVAMREKLIADLEQIRVPDGPLELILNHFGPDVVGEVTGRTQRVVRKPNPEGQVVAQLEKRGPQHARADAEAFMADKRKILVFSDAGGTGFSFHADLTKDNQRKRAHYLIQPGWRADKAVQGFGRSHRTNQKQPPHYWLVTTDVPAQKRFLSSIARRLDQLGALTKGQRDASGQSMFSEKDNLESQYATGAVRMLLDDAKAGQIEGIDFEELLLQLGLDDIVNPDTGRIAEDKYPPTRQFLNRMLSLRLDMQEKVFAAFIGRMEELIDLAAQRGQLDAGMQTIRGLSTKVVQDEVVHTDARTGAATRFVELEVTLPTVFHDFPSEKKQGGKIEWVVNNKSGKVWAKVRSGTQTLRSGAIVDRFRMVGTNGTQSKPASEIQADAYRTIDADEAREMWTAENAKRAPTYTKSLHMVVGALLPIWDRLQTSGTIQVARTNTSDGQRLLGRVIPEADVQDVRQRLSLSAPESKLPAAEVIKRVLAGDRAELTNGWTLERATVSGSKRVELKLNYRNPSWGRYPPDGIILERIEWTQRYFIATGPEGAKALADILESKPVAKLAKPADDDGPLASQPFQDAGERVQPITPKLLGQVESTIARARKKIRFPIVTHYDSPTQLHKKLAEDTGGAYWLGVVHVWPRNVASLRDLQRILVHEIVGHAGMMNMMGSAEYKKLVDVILKAKQTGNREVMRLAGIVRQTHGSVLVGPEAELIEASEIMAAAAEQAIDAEGNFRPGYGWFKEILSRISAWLRDAGITVPFTLSELQGLLIRSARYVAETPATRAAQTEAALRAGARPLWYSALTRAVGEMKRGSGTAKEWNLAIAQLPGVKKDELQWSGLQEWLELQPGKVSKEQILEYLDANGVQVTETILAEREAEPRNSEIDMMTVQLTALGYQPEINEYGELGGVYGPDPNGARDDRALFEWDDGEAGVGAGWFARGTNDPMLHEEAAELATMIRNLRREITEDDPPVRPPMGTRFSQYKLPGGENYREVLLTLPAKRPAEIFIVREKGGKERARVKTQAEADEALKTIPQGFVSQTYEASAQPFRSSHFDQPNIVAHIRVDDRVDADGKRVLFIEEFQSDWAEQGRDRGFKRKELPTELPPDHSIYEYTNSTGHYFQVVRDYGNGVIGGAGGRSAATREAAIREYWQERNFDATLTGPFVQKTEAWVALALKRAILMAVDGGYDRVAWTTGDQQNDRYPGLVDHVDRIEVVPRTDARTGERDRSVALVLKNGSVLRLGVDANGVVDNTSGAQGMAEAKGKSLGEVIGKEPAVRVMAVPLGEKGAIEGDGLKLGAEPMRAFYDRMVPNIANDVLKKLGGGRVREVPLDIGFEEYKKYAAGPRHRIEQQPGFDITPELIEKAAGGLPLMHRARVAQTATPQFRKWFGDSKVVDADGKPLVVYHGTPADEDFDEFRPLSHFGTKEQANAIAEGFRFLSQPPGSSHRVLPVYLQIQRPVRIVDTGVEHHPRALTEAALDAGALSHSQYESVLYNEDGDLRADSEMADELRYELGNQFYDGFVYANSAEGDGDSYIPLWPEQIKSAIGNSGAFDPNEPSILMAATAGRAQAAQGRQAQPRGITIKPDGTRTTLIDALSRKAGGEAFVKHITSPLWTRFAALGRRVIPNAVKVGIGGYDLPEPYVHLEHDRSAAINSQLRDSKNLLDQVANLDRSQARVAYEWMTDIPSLDTEMAILESLPEDSRQVLSQMKQQVRELGRRAVELGLMTQETYERNELTYLRRSYLKYEKGLTFEQRAARKRAIALRGENFKKRGLRDDASMAQIIADDPIRRERGKADTALKGRKFQRLERRSQPTGTPNLAGMDGESLGPLREVVYVPAEAPIPEKYSGWRVDGEWEARFFNKPGQVGMWRDFTADEQQRMGVIDEVRFAFAKTMLNMIHDVETAQFLKYVASQFGKVSEDEVTEAGGTIVSRIADRQSTLQTFKSDEWVKVPMVELPGTELRKYGALAGRYVPGAIWNDLRSTMNIRGEHDLVDVWDKMMLIWKLSKTALNPAVHMNNVMSNFFLADFADVRGRDIAKSLLLLYKARRGDEDAKAVLHRYQDSGAELGSMLHVDLRSEVMDPLLEQLEGIASQAAGNVGALAHASQIMSLVLHGRLIQAYQQTMMTKAGKFAKWPVEKMIALYGKEDTVFRLAAFLKSIEEGKSDRAGGELARKAFLDYRINAPWVQALRRTGLPFIAFSYRAIPLLIDVAVNKPWKLLKYSSIAGGLNALFYAMLGLGSDDEEEERRLLPEELQGRTAIGVPRMMRMPWNDEHDSPVFLDIRRWIPAGDIVDTNNAKGVLALPGWLGLGGPLAMVTEIAANKSLFTGKPIYNDSDTIAEKTAKSFDYLYKFWMPNIPNPGDALGYVGESLLGPAAPTGFMQTYTTTRFRKAASGETDPFGRDINMGQAAASGIGIKINAYPKDEMTRRAVGAAAAKEREINETMGQARRSAARGGLSDAQLGERLEYQADKKIEVRRKLAEKLGGLE